jgi:hypothetical protein
MIRTFEAIIDTKGNVQLSEPIELPSSCRALITILDEKAFSHVNKEALLSEAALAEDWDRPEENEAWKYLQKDQ